MTAMNMNSYNFQPSFNSQSPQFFPKTYSPRAVQAFVPAPELLPMNKMELNLTPMKKSLTSAAYDTEEVHSDASTSADSICDVKKNGKFDRTKEYKKK